jgi:DNA repair exonuclease SbcCD ATPase subunit
MFRDGIAMETRPLPTAVDLPSDAGAPCTDAAPPPDAWAERFRDTIAQQHRRMRNFLDAQRDRWQQVESLLNGQLQVLDSEVSTLRATCEDLRQRLAVAAQSPAGESDAAAEIDELRAQNTDLLAQRAELRAAPAAIAAHVPGAVSDWETEKRRILAALESDDAQNAPPSRRLEIEEIVRRTSRVVAEKNREIAELKHLLQSQSESVGAVAVGAAAIEQIFDQDGIIREERQRLHLLQEEWRKKLREAEIEISLQRATIARQQAEIEEKQRLFASNAAPVDNSNDALCPTGRPVRGRWLARLGITDASGRIRDDE